MMQSSRLFNQYINYAIVTFGIGLLFILQSFTDGGGHRLAHQQDAGFDAVPGKLKKDTSGIDYDGPHIFYRGDKTIIKQVLKNEAGFYVRMDTLTTSFKGRHITCHVNDTTRFTTTIKKSLNSERAVYPAPDKLLAISDIEGNFMAFRNLLVSNGVMSADYHWTFGTGHLVLNGDFFDRGLHVTECLWLIYHLEQEAVASGGYVHFILGNHEIMNMNDDLRYVRAKYFQNTFLLKVPYAAWYTPDTELGRWLQTKNVAEKIGNYLFVHGGISPEVFQQKAGIEKINSVARTYYYKEDRALESSNSLVAALYNGYQAPTWYRGYSDGTMDETLLDDIMKHFEVTRIVIGHSIVEKVRYLYHGKIISIDTDHATGDSEGLLVEDGMEYRVDGTGHRSPIE